MVELQLMESNLYHPSVHRFDQLMLISRNGNLSWTLAAIVSSREKAEVRKHGERRQGVYRYGSRWCNNRTKVDEEEAKLRIILIREMHRAYRVLRHCSVLFIFRPLLWLSVTAIHSALRISNACIQLARHIAPALYRFHAKRCSLISLGAVSGKRKREMESLLRGVQP